jgi:pSer/pThr/pTyr-binding forkhead associated (FHA) protein
MTDLVVTLLRFGFLALLWFAVIKLFLILRSDLLGASSELYGAIKPKRVQLEPRELVVVEGPAAGSSVLISKRPITVGRASICDLALDDDFISSRHLRVSVQENGYVAEDLGSTNGTWVQGERLVEPVLIKPGVRIKMGRNTLTIRKVEA